MKASTSATSSLIQLVDSKSKKNQSQRQILEVESRQQQERLFSIEDAELCVLNELYDAKLKSNYEEDGPKGAGEKKQYVPAACVPWSWEMGWKESCVATKTAGACGNGGKETDNAKERLEKLKKDARIRLDAILKQLQ